MKTLGILGLGVLFIILQSSLVQGANIMFFFGISSYSHRIAVWPLVEKLSERGHSITFVSPFPNKSKHPKVIDYAPQSLIAEMESWNETSNFYNMRRTGQIENEWFRITDYGTKVCEALLNDPKFVGWINKSKFDLIVIDGLFNECAYGMAYKLKAKIIVYNTATSFPHFPETFGYPDESSWLPDMVYHFPQDMNIFQRFVTMMVPLYFKFLREVQYFPKLEEIVRDKLKIKDMPSFSEIESKISLVLLNHHYAEDYARPFSPNVIPVGGMQCAETIEQLPKELDDFLKKGTTGFIYMSFGSYAELSKFPQHVQDVFMNTVKKFKHIQFVWKREKGSSSKDLPPNVYSGHWFPQHAILSHPKIRAFITHGGLLGIQEAICTSVPLIAFPIFAEQDYNAVKVDSREIGITLEITTVTEKQLEDAINKILDDEKYHKNMKRISVAFRDRPARPVDTAVWWTEFVLRHKDTDLLRPSSVGQSWWKRRQLDVWALIFLAILGIVSSIFCVVKFIFRKCFGGAKPSVKKVKSS